MFVSYVLNIRINTYMGGNLDNLKSEIFKYFEGKKILLLGFARSNKAVSKLLDECKIDFDVADEKLIDIESFKNSKVSFLFGEKYLDKISDYDMIFRSPGIKYNDKMKEALKKGVEFTSEISLFDKYCKRGINLINSLSD